MSVVPLKLPTEAEAKLSNRTSAVRIVSSVLRSGVHGVDNLPDALLRAINLRAWEAFETPLGHVYSNKDMTQWIVSAPPQGLGSSIERIRQLLTATERAEEALLAFDREMQRPAGGANNPHRDVDTGKLLPKPLNVDNVNGEEHQRPTGNTAQAGLRRLRKAADAGDEQAGDLLGKVIDATSDMSVHRACKEMGWRKDVSPLKAVQAAWRKADQEQREQIAAWVDGQMSPLAKSRFA